MQLLPLAWLCLGLAVVCAIPKVDEQGLRTHTELSNDKRVLCAHLNIYTADECETLLQKEVNSDFRETNIQASQDMERSIQPVIEPSLYDAHIDGFEMVFRATSGNGHNVYDAWQSGTLTTTVKPTSMDRSLGSHYRDPIVGSWTNLNIQYVKYGFYYEGREVAYILFNGKDSSNMNWFDKSRVIASSWTDLTATGTYNYFSIYGDLNFEYPLLSKIFVNKSYGGCPNDLGWMIVVDTGTANSPCAFDTQPVYPQFIYSRINAPDLYERGMYGRADYMAIFIKTR